MNSLDVATGDDDEIGAVARLGQGGHRPTRRLQNLQIPVERLARGMVDDTARALGKRQHRTHAANVGGKSAKQGKLGLADQLCCFRNRRRKIGIFAIHARVGPRQFTFETGDRFAGAVLDHLEAGFAPLNHEIVGKRAAERVDHVLEHSGACALGLRLARA
jgi:hypothetical protein